MHIKNILVPADFSKCADNALSYAANIAKKIDPGIYLMYTEISAYSYTALDRLNDQIDNESFFEGFSDYLDEHKISLVVVTQYKKSFIEQVVQKDHTKQIEYYSNVPLLVLNSKESS